MWYVSLFMFLFLAELISKLWLLLYYHLPALLDRSFEVFFVPDWIVQTEHLTDFFFVQPCDISLIMFYFRAGPNALSIQPIHKWDIFFKKGKYEPIKNRRNQLTPRKDWELTLISIYGLKGIGSELTPGFICFCALVANTFLFVYVFFLLLFCSWCLFISQRLYVNMSIWIKHIVCIYCLFTCIACKNNHSSFHVYSTTNVS